jgi:hypothetical protein
MEDPETRRRQGRQAAEYVRNEWTWEQGLDRYERQVAKLLERERIASTKGLQNQVREVPPARLQ